ncbi:MAG: B12-binding domain-containing radical SAM protein [Planctomycetota bacterium]|jgi:radical SAM superfamily enzyme YgiQ (UPF0313 family)
MKVTFLRPAMGAARTRDAMEPLALGILAGLTPPDVEVELIDERVEPVPASLEADLVALTVETYTARRSYQLADELRSRGLKVVMGGYHPSLLPEEVGRHADAVVIGDAEELWPRVLDHARRGRLQSVYRRESHASLAGMHVDRRLFAGKHYAPVSLVQYSRGCRWACDFCSIHAFYGTSLLQRPIAEVVAEIEQLPRRHVFFVDDNLFVDRVRLKALLRALVPLGIRWSCQVSIDVTQDAELVRLMQRSGCVTALVGFESLNGDNLRQMGKGWNLRFGGYERAIRTLKDAGILIYGTFVFGYDGDTPAAFDEAVDFALHHKLFLANFNPLTPTPGAPLHDRLAREGRLLHDRWWTDPGYRYGEATFRPRGMTGDELTEGCYRARTRFNTYSSIARRLLGQGLPLTNPYRTSLFLMSNLLSRREIRRKQGRPLGAAPAVEVSA